MSKLKVYRDTLEINGRTITANGVCGPVDHRCEVYDGNRRMTFCVKRDRRYPFGPALRNETIRRFMEALWK